MNKHQAFTAWAPPASIWSVWAKPVVFAHMPAHPLPRDPLPMGISAFEAPSIADRCAIILDLPGHDAIPLALSLASAGYRPVPLYNAVPILPVPFGGQALDVMPILMALQDAAPQLANFQIADDAPPVFLLDARRSVGVAPVAPGAFDNRSISLPSDFPSAAFLQSRDIRQILLVQASQIAPLQDLSHTLLRYQQADLPILSQRLDALAPPQPIRVRRPSLYRSTLYRLFALVGLRRNPLGGFGGHLPNPSAG